MVDDFDKSSREQRVNVGWHFKSVARVSAYGEFFKRSERERESFNWRREGGGRKLRGLRFRRTKSNYGMVSGNHI